LCKGTGFIVVKMNTNKRVVISGSPGGGKTSIIDVLKNKQHIVFEEYSRSLIQTARDKGTENLFLEDPQYFSEQLFLGRQKQFEAGTSSATSKESAVFYDRGIHDIYAYLLAINKATPLWKEKVQAFTYDLVFLVPPWEEIYTRDEQRLETFEEAKYYYPFLKEVYAAQHKVVEVPEMSVVARVDFITSYIQQHG